MKRIVSLAALLVLVCSHVHAHRGISREVLVEDYRPVGELRMWTFVGRDSTIGRLFSTVAGRTRIAGIEALVFEDRLGLDFTKTGSDLVFEVEGEHFVSSVGAYLGDKISLTINHQAERLELSRQDDSLTGFITREGKKVTQTHHCDKAVFSLDSYLLDQHELFLAMRDIRVGDTLVDTVFVPHIMMKARVVAVVEDFIHKQLYKNVFDSVFVIRCLEPQNAVYYFTPDKRLVKAEFPNQKLKAYLDIVRMVGRDQPAESGLGGRKFMSLLPTYLAYLLLGLMAAGIFVGRGYKWRISYLSLVLGGVTFLLVAVTQMPLQLALLKHLLMPRVMAGGSPYFWGIFPALSAGIIQEVLKFGLIVALARLAGTRGQRLTVIGAACGAGLGVVEGCYLARLAGAVDVFSWHLLDRGFMTLMHATSGALLGYALARGFQSRQWLAYLAAMIVCNTILRYLPVFTQQKAIPAEVMYFLISILALGLLLFAMLQFKREGNRAFPNS